MFYPIDKNNVVITNTIYYPHLSMSNSDKVFLYQDNDKNINRLYQNKISYVISNGTVYTYKTAVNNLSCSVSLLSYNTTTDKSMHGVIKNLCNIYSAYETNYKYVDNYTDFVVISLSHFVIGSKIMSGSFKFDDHTNVDYYTDNSRGLILLDGTTVSGKIFYREGWAVITRSADVATLAASTYWTFECTGSYSENKATINMELQKNRATCSTNDSYYTTGSNGIRTRVLTKEEVFYDTINIYDENYDLVAITKTSQPIRKDKTLSEIIRVNFTY